MAIIRLLIIAILLLLPGGACTSRLESEISSQGEETRMSTPVEATGGGDTQHFIYATTQSQFGDSLRVGAGNIWEEEYTGEDGTSTTGLTAGLWFFVRDQPDLNQHMRVHPGQRLT